MFKYELVNEDECEKIVKFDTVCEADNEQLYASNALDIGYKYNCKVDPDRTRYNFFVLSYNDENGNIIFDKENATSINLIMDRNINSDGTPTTKALLESDKEENSGIYNLVAYNSSGDASGTGPVTAMTHLNNATISWENIDNLNITYDDEGEFFTDFALNGKARLPYYSEVDNVGCLDYERFTCPVWMVDYLSDAGPVYETETTYQENPIEDIYGYWTLSSVGNSTNAWYVEYYGSMGDADTVACGTYYGARPVINLKI